MKSRMLVFAAGVLVFSLAFFALDYLVMDLQGLPLNYEHQE